jgi:hypothetical protein
MRDVEPVKGVAHGSVIYEQDYLPLPRFTAKKLKTRCKPLLIKERERIVEEQRRTLGRRAAEDPHDRQPLNQIDLILSAPAQVPG